jgi:flagellar basal body-associated protein FliL
LSYIFYRILILLVWVLIGILIRGTIYAFVRSPVDNPVRLSETERAGLVPQEQNDIRVFSGLGRLRIPLSNSSILILSIAFPYLESDTAFTVELAGKIGEFRAIAIDYFSSLPADKLINLDEEAAKTEILGKFNNSLRLGNISLLFFSDMMIINAIQ